LYVRPGQELHAANFIDERLLTNALRNVR